MKELKNIVIAAVAGAVVAVAACCFICCSHCNKQKVAVVDVQKIVEHSKDVAAFNEDMQNKKLELQKWLDESGKEVEKVKEKDMREKLIAQYRQEFTQKYQELQNEELVRTQELNNQITKVVEEAGKKAGYDHVFAAGVVIYGAQDITDVVLKAME